MATSYTTNYQIKLIGTGEEASTWGDSTNASLSKVEQMVGGNVELGVTSPPSASTWTNGTDTLTWITSNTAVAGAANSEGRAAFVTFIDGSSAGEIDGTVTVEVKGDTSGDNPQRVFFVKNGLSAQDITLKSGSASYTLKNGAHAVIGTTGSAISNVLNTLQVGAIDFVADTSGEIKIADNQAASFKIKEGTNDYITADTDAKSVKIGAQGVSDLAVFDVDEGFSLAFSSTVRQLTMKKF